MDRRLGPADLPPTVLMETTSMNFVAIGNYRINLDNVACVIVEKTPDGKERVLVRLLLASGDNAPLEFKGKAARRLLDEIKRRTTTLKASRPGRPRKSPK